MLYMPTAMKLTHHSEAEDQGCEGFDYVNGSLLYQGVLMRQQMIIMASNFKMIMRLCFNKNRKAQSSYRATHM